MDQPKLSHRAKTGSKKSSPAFSRYGVREQKIAHDKTDIHVQRLEILGYSVVKSGFTEDEISNYRGLIDGLLQQQTEATGGLKALADIQEADLFRACLVYDDSFLKIAANEKIREIVRRMMGTHVLMQQNAIINRPSTGAHHQTAYHRDLPYQHWVASRPLAINALLCIDDFKPETGSTNILPGSHKVEYFPDDEYVAMMEEAVTVPAGSYIVFNAMMYHRAGVNISKNMRRAVNNVYTIPFIQQQIILPAMLDGKWSDDEDLAQLLGYKTDPVRSVAEWRKTRLDRKNAPVHKAKK